MADYMSVVTVIAPVVAAVVGYFAKRALDRAPRVVAFMAASNSVTLGKGKPNEVTIHSHVLVIRNDGALAARDVRITHDFFPPDISVYPGVEHTLVVNPQGLTELQVPLLAPGQQLAISYMYFPPLTWAQINCDVYSETGRAERVALLPRPKPATWILVTRYFLMFAGAWAVVYWLARLGYAMVTRSLLFPLAL